MLGLDQKKGKGIVYSLYVVLLLLWVLHNLQIGQSMVYFTHWTTILLLMAIEFNDK